MEIQEAHPVQSSEINSQIMDMISSHHSTEQTMPPPQVYILQKDNFTVVQHFTPCLAHMAYIIISGTEAAIIDPLRENQQYLKELQDREVVLKYIILTHFHADFVSGHYDLSLKTGA